MSTRGDKASMRDYASLQGSISAVVFGASAGGIEALSMLLAALPAELPAAVMGVLHLPRDRPSLLVEIFAPMCALPVQEAQDKEHIKPGHVYFAPSDYHLLVDTGPSLALSIDEPVNFSRPSIDVLFESAADAYGSRVAGVVLSGANTDGASGLRAIAAAGGVTIVQSPATAEAPTMPEAALQACPHSHVVDAKALARWLASLERRAS
jgi:two-component system chemotaxis response regulator CheB